jgi:hypothetical protein
LSIILFGGTFVQIWQFRQHIHIASIKATNK